MSDDANQNSGNLVPWIIWGALLLTLGIYGIVLQIVVSQPDPNRQLPDPSLVYILGAVAAGEIPVIFMLRHIQFFAPLENGEISDVDELRGRYFTVSITTWALCESIAIFGFVLGILSGDMIYYFPFAGVGAALMIYFRPKFDRHIETLREQSDSGETDDTPRDAPPDDDPIEQTESW